MNNKEQIFLLLTTVKRSNATKAPWDKKIESLKSSLFRYVKKSVFIEWLTDRGDISFCDYLTQVPAEDDFFLFHMLKCIKNGNLLMLRVILASEWWCRRIKPYKCKTYVFMMVQTAHRRKRRKIKNYLNKEFEGCRYGRHDDNFSLICSIAHIPKQKKREYEKEDQRSGSVAMTNLFN